MTNFMNLTQPMNFRAMRESSWDRSGGNVDSIADIQPGETRVLADLKGPGVISHIWITAADTDDISTHWKNGKVCVYRYHMVDPIPFTKNLRVSIEHGHANHMENDISTVAYWYQDEPHLPFPAMMAADARVPGEDRFLGKQEKIGSS